MVSSTKSVENDNKSLGDWGRVPLLWTTSLDFDFLFLVEVLGVCLPLEDVFAISAVENVAGDDDSCERFGIAATVEEKECTFAIWLLASLQPGLQ